jgi:dipeptidyl aminopeptidase/acylaminoacyl peptidase
LEDVVASVAYLKTLPEVDARRIAVLGQSGGALLALFAITHVPDLFAAAVDFYGPANLATWYKDAPSARPLLTAALGGSPAEKPEAYRAASPISSIQNMRVPLLILQGDRDFDVPLSQSTELAQALKKADKQVELVIIKGGEHGFLHQRTEPLERAYVFLTTRMP